MAGANYKILAIMADVNNYFIFKNQFGRIVENKHSELYNITNCEQEAASVNRIKELRLERGWKQDELGEMIQVGKGSVSRYEAEKRQLDPEAINALCDLFNCTADYLLGRSSARHPAVSEEDALLIQTYHALPLAIRQAVDGLMAPYMATSEKKKAL